MSLTKAPPWNNVHVHPPALEHIYEGCSFSGWVGNLNCAGSTGMLVLWVGKEFELSGMPGNARFVSGTGGVVFAMFKCRG